VGDPARTVTPVEQDGRRLAVLLHDAAATEDQPLVEAVVAAARLALENARLHAEERLHQARLVEVAVAERRKIERNLHDSVQGRLLALIGDVKQARASIGSRDGELAGLLEELEGQASRAYNELRELAQGIHPSILTGKGLAAAVIERTLRGPLPVLVDLPHSRWPAAVEATAFFAVSEALTNAVKHAHATKIEVRGWQQDQRLLVEVTDDGCGGADPLRGSGLSGLGYRVRALGGTLTVHSPPGHGTSIVVELPCA
jgi:signal transduction histidine kinase